MDFENNRNSVDQLVHIYEDGAFNRRELIRRRAMRGARRWPGSISTCASEAYARQLIPAPSVFFA